jgi:hypothetical protein
MAGRVDQAWKGTSAGLPLENPVEKKKEREKKRQNPHQN